MGRIGVNRLFIILKIEQSNKGRRRKRTERRSWRPRTRSSNAKSHGAHHHLGSRLGAWKYTAPTLLCASTIQSRGGIVRNLNMSKQVAHAEGTARGNHRAAHMHIAQIATAAECYVSSVPGDGPAGCCVAEPRFDLDLRVSLRASCRRRAGRAPTTPDSRVQRGFEGGSQLGFAVSPAQRRPGQWRCACSCARGCAAPCVLGPPGGLGM